ncbi:MAG: hypothetical protein XD88_2157 [Methanocalculus sp. 52_23]|nr:MAG: hypothetical protein XD88_2157 [Methanocalculus sp. 52_23]
MDGCKLPLLIESRCKFHPNHFFKLLPKDMRLQKLETRRVGKERTNPSEGYRTLSFWQDLMKVITEVT